ncbi:MAG: hypothetical protein RL385_5399 [Pseudomonadota bacterium]
MFTSIVRTRSRRAWLFACAFGLASWAGACCRSASSVRATTPALLSAPSGPDAPRRERYVPAQIAAPGKPSGQYLEGDASFYANFFSGRLTANGERYDPRKLTAANGTLPFGTRLRVTRLDTGRSVTVKVNDRGPFGKRRRILDLSRAAAEQLDMIRVGHTAVRAEILD